MWWLAIPAVVIIGGWLYGAKLVTTNAPPLTGPFARNGQVIRDRSLVVVNGLNPIFQKEVVEIGVFPEDLGPFTTLGTHINDTFTMRVLTLFSIRGPDFVQAAVEDPRITLPGIFDIPISTIVDTIKGEP